MNRRSFLGCLAAAPIIAPLAAVAAKPAISSAYASYSVGLTCDGYVSGVSMVGAGETLTVRADKFAIDRAKEAIEEAYRSFPTEDEYIAVELNHPLLLHPVEVTIG